MTTDTLPVFTTEQKTLATKLLSAKVATMLGRKLEEADWDFVYSNTKEIPITDWSNLNIDINYDGLGVEHKMLRVNKSGSILGDCGTTKMHPSGTRSIRIPDENDPNLAMENILNQYCELVESRTQSVKEMSESGEADMRIGWLLYKGALDEFLYFEERMEKPDHKDFYAEWSITPARGTRKESRSLWVYDKDSGKKKYSVTTSAGAKIQPYFDVPSLNDANLYHFKVQGVLLDGGLVQVWLTKSTAKYLELLLGSLDSDAISTAIANYSPADPDQEQVSDKFPEAEDIAVPVNITLEAYEKLKSLYVQISDEYMLQQFAINLGEDS